jgi:hypothetical protein
VNDTVQQLTTKTGLNLTLSVRMEEADRQKRADSMRDTIMFKLDRTGEKDKMKDMLRDKLIHSGITQVESSNVSVQIYLMTQEAYQKKFNSSIMQKKKNTMNKKK